MRELPPAGDPPLAPWPGDFVASAGGRIFVRRVPDAAGSEPGVYVHGLGGASTNWTDLQYLLADRIDGAALDLPGFGRSDPPPDGDYRLRTHVRAVTDLVRAAGAPVHLFGNSLGGAVAIRVAARSPELVRTLTLVSPAMPQLRLRRGADPRVALLALPGVGEAVAGRASRQRPERRVRALLDLCYFDPSSVPEQRRAEAAAEVTRRDGVSWAADALTGSLRGLIRTYLRTGGRSLWSDLGSVRAPTLVVWGRQDRLVPAALARRVAASAGGRLLLLDRCGHVAQMEAPRTVAAAVLDLLGSAPQAGAGRILRSG